ncbi:hypothetical protein ACFQQB_38170 [Nonomuraea rubra]|uniref:hypothetical protein n=1 Tax=Nonomuraea rubra TaxID=46180 RepID=UPI003614EC0C
MFANTSRPTSVVEMLGSRASGSALSAMLSVPPALTGRWSAEALAMELGAAGVLLVPPPPQAARARGE